MFVTSPTADALCWGWGPRDPLVPPCCQGCGSLGPSFPPCCGSSPSAAIPRADPRQIPDDCGSLENWEQGRSSQEDWYWQPGWCWAVGLGCRWKALGRAALSRESIQEEINLVTEPSLRLGQKGKSGNKIIKKYKCPVPPARQWSREKGSDPGKGGEAGTESPCWPWGSLWLPPRAPPGMSSWALNRSLGAVTWFCFALQISGSSYWMDCFCQAGMPLKAKGIAPDCGTQSWELSHLHAL